MSGERVRSARLARALLRLALGIGVIAAVLAIVDVRALAVHVREASGGWFAVAVGTALCANLCSAARWATIARGLGARVRVRDAAVFYFRAITVNTLLPGATLGGDAFRAFELIRRGNPVVPSTLSVLLDRFAGLWAQAALSLAALAVFVATGSEAMEPAFAAGYALLLVALVAAPWLPLDALPGGDGSAFGRVRSVWRAWRRFRSEQPRALLRIALLAFGVALGSTCAFWFCLHAVGLDVSFLAALAVTAGIFLAGAVPVAIAGFGPREMGAAAAFAAMGATAAPATAASVLYGLAATAQGILAAPLFAWRVPGARAVKGPDA